MKGRIQRKLATVLIFLLIFQPLSIRKVGAKEEIQVKEAISKDEVKTENTLAYANAKGKTLLNMYGLTSFQYAIIDGGDIVVSGQAGYGNKEKKAEPTNTTMYGIASISKMYVTVAVLQLVDQGLVDLDAPVIDYVDDFTMSDERYVNITVRMLLNHSSGLMGTTEKDAFTLGDNDHSTYENFLTLVSNQRLKANPGELSVYCNDGFTLAEILVERVSGLPYSTYIARYIRMPLELWNTHTPWESFQKRYLAKVYNMKNQQLPYEGLHMYGAGGLYSTAEEVCQFAQLFMEDSNTDEILSRDMAELMSQEEGKKGIWLDESTTTMDYGLGWDHVNAYPFSEYGIKALSKAGDLSYYHGNLIVLPEYNMAVCVLSVGGSSTIDEYFGRELLMTYLIENGVIQEKINLPSTIDYKKAEMPEEYKEYSGVYGNFSSQCTVEVKENKLTLSASGVLPMEYLYSSTDWFVSKSGKEAYRFVTEENGETYLAYQNYTNVLGFGPYYSCLYVGQKLKENPISEDMKAIWSERSEKMYFAMTEKESSIYYNNSIPVYQLQILNGIEGYTSLGKIVDENTIIQDYQIPMVYGRDLNDSVFFQKNEIEYVSFNDMVFIEESAINKLPLDKEFYHNVDDSGYGTYYKVGKKAEGKKITITVPKDASFILFNENYMPKNNYYVSQEATITLKKGDYLLFLGDKGDQFTITYHNPTVLDK